jgi:hypothetical protein
VDPISRAKAQREAKQAIVAATFIQPTHNMDQDIYDQNRVQVQVPVTVANRVISSQINADTSGRSAAQADGGSVASNTPKRPTAARKVSNYQISLHWPLILLDFSERRQRPLRCIKF